MKVYLDDLRETPDGWTRTYSVADTIALLKRGGVTEISLDHDLGQTSDGVDLPSGYEVLTWIEWEVATMSDYTPPIIHIHSANAAAVKRMKAAVDQILKLWLNSRDR